MYSDFSPASEGMLKTHTYLYVC